MSLTRREAMIATAATAAVTASVPGAQAAQPIAPYTAACVHTRVIPTITEAGADAEALKANIDTTVAAIEKGAGEIDARLYVFSEFNLQFAARAASVQAWVDGAISIPGPETDRIGKAAQAARCYVAINPVEKIAAFPGRYFLSGVVIGPSGDVLVNYRKLYDLSNKTRPTDILDQWLAKFGPQSLFPVADTDIGRIGAAVALDVNWPEMIRSLVFNGAEIIVNSTASPMNARGYTLPETPGSVDIRTMVRRVRAFENLVYMLTTNLGPTGRDRNAPLSQMLPSEIVDYRGRALATAKDSAEGYLTATIDIEALRKARSATEPLNSLAQLQAEVHRRGYDAAHFARMNAFAKKPIKNAEEHQPLFRGDIDALIRRGVLKTPAG